MITRKSGVDIVICCGGGVEVLGPTTSAGAMILGTKGSEGAEDAGAEGGGVVEAGAGAENDGT